MKKAIIIFFSWILPGFGQFALGKKLQGILIFVLLSSTYFTGLAMSDFQAVSISYEPYYFFCQMGAAGFTVVANLVTYNIPRNPIFYQQSYQIGILYTSIVGLVNGIILIHLWKKNC